MQLTEEQLAEGWVAILPGQVSCPEALLTAQGGEWEFMYVNSHDDGRGISIAGLPAAYNGWSWAGKDERHSGIVAYRILKPATQAPAPVDRPLTEQDVFERWLDHNRPSGDVDAVQRAWLESGDYEDWRDEETARTNPNTDMIARDGEPQTFEQRVTQLAGNGMIFGTPPVERSPLLIVAPITATGRAMWGEQS